MMAYTIHERWGTYHSGDETNSSEKTDGGGGKAYGNMGKLGFGLWALG